MGYLFLVLNVVLWLTVFSIQQWESKTQKISHRRKWDKNNPNQSFLYLQDWNTGSWGDLVGLSLVMFVFGESLPYWSGTNALTASIISSTITFLLHDMWRKGRRNSGYPSGEGPSFSGKVHLVYTFLHIFTAVYLFLSIWGLGEELIALMIVGATIYSLSVIADYKQGKFSKGVSSGM